jgi:hypothetical protein
MGKHLNHEARRSSRRRRALKRKYGITSADYEALLSAQGGVCAICGLPPKQNKRLHVDHDHSTAQVRGLLCHNCNLILGLAHDSEAVLLRATLYLEENA